MEENKTIISPIPGVFYRKPSPDQEVFVNEGDSVKAGDVIGLVEVMKNYYEIKAEADGVIESFLVEEEQLLDAGQEIAKLK
ncbi:acetyl-CoA carboxylase [Bacillus norwichensis]|uniref:Biotin carboxyl carrier protein of acetyl-CoA carboxylase n=1 Tax=Bacillus norwichensis TaxID=2762217 RepID=A0ABR8VHN8_9BACI|nr:acetyl-CoA carboxylase [Bacillus norwichensis]MBD8004121.1 biotin carboxyl carrier domain-containing protein [Bacillus norwichensis]